MLLVLVKTTRSLECLSFQSFFRGIQEFQKHTSSIGVHLYRLGGGGDEDLGCRPK